jgi:hypothetical protein
VKKNTLKQPFQVSHTKNAKNATLGHLAGIEHVARVVARTLPFGGGGGVMLDLPEFIQLNVFT